MTSKEAVRVGTGLLNYGPGLGKFALRARPAWPKVA